VSAEKGERGAAGGVDNNNAQRPRVGAAVPGRLTHNECREAIQLHNKFVFSSEASLVLPIPELREGLGAQLQGPAGGIVKRVKHRNLGNWRFMTQAPERELYWAAWNGATAVAALSTDLPAAEDPGTPKRPQKLNRSSRDTLRGGTMFSERPERRHKTKPPQIAARSCLTAEEGRHG
jgi:hypothetical protein